MAFQSVPNTALFTAYFSGPDGTTPSFSLASNNDAGPWDATQMGVVAGDLETAIVTNYLPKLSTDFTFNRVVVRDLEVEHGRVLEREPIDDPGTLASPSLPAHVAVRVAFIGEPGNEPARGGIYLLPPTEGQVVGSKLSAGAVTDLQAVAESLHEAMAAVGPAHVIISRYNGTTETDGPGNKVFRTPIKRAEAVTNEVNTVIVRQILASQRKRRPTA